MNIEIVWQTHLLRSEIYQTDCLRLFRRIIDHSLFMDDFQDFLKEQAFPDTCHLYEQYYPLLSTKEKMTVQYNIVPLRDKDHCINSIYFYWDQTYFEFLSDLSKDFENFVFKARDQTDNIWKQEFESDITTDHLYNTIAIMRKWDD
ncbi:hypothetical protein I4U23_019860 [Adineta vaga]|nr:hypothetical protein I4U23_019860 [Adineta vaga]